MNRIKIFFIALITSTTVCAQDSKFVQTENGTFPVIDEGTGMPILLLHGFPDSKEVWKNQIPVLVDAGFRVIAPDLRGYGNAPSPLEKEKYTIPILMSDVIGILDELSLDKVHLVGHDWGASLSWQLVKYYEDRFISLSVLSVGFPGNSAMSSVEQRRHFWYFYLFLQEGLAEKTFADYDWKFAREALNAHPELEKVISRFKKENALTTALNWYRGNLQHMLAKPGVDYKPSNEKTAMTQDKIEIPVLGIWSELDDALLEPQMKQSTEFASNFTYKKIMGAGHWMMFEKPDELNSLILNFLDELEIVKTH